MTQSSLSSADGIRQPQGDVPAYGRRNFVLLTLDVTSFFIGLAFLDASTVLPALVTALHGGPVVLGALAALKQAGFLLPQLLVAHQLQGRTRYLPFLLCVCFWGRLWLFPAAVVILLQGRTAPAVALGALAVAYGLLWIGDGAGVVPWTAMVGRMIPARQRGRFFALTQILGGLGRIAVARLIVTEVLKGKTVPFPGNAALLVFCCALFMAISFVFLVLLREPPARASAPSDGPGVGLRTYLAGLPQHLRARPDFGRLALVQILASVLSAVSPFYLGLARAAVPVLPVEIAGSFLIALTAGGLVCAPLWGWLTDRRGPRTALLALFLVSLLSPIASVIGAALSGPLITFFVAFFCLGAVMEGGWAVFTNYLLETIPEAEQPTYIGLMSALNAPTLLLPLGAGLLIPAIGAPAVLLLAVALLAAGLALVYSLPDPRRQVAS